MKIDLTPVTGSVRPQLAKRFIEQSYSSNQPRADLHNVIDLTDDGPLTEKAGDSTVFGLHTHIRVRANHLTRLWTSHY